MDEMAYALGEPAPTTTMDEGAVRADADSPSSADYKAGDAVLVIGDTPAARGRAAAAAASAGLRVLARLDPSEAVERLRKRASSGLVIVEMEEVPAEAGPAFEQMLRQLNEDAACGRHASVVSTPAALIDVVAALAPDPGVYQLADATDLERVAALTLAAAPQPMWLRDSASENADAIRLAHLTDEVARIASALARLSASAAPASMRQSGPRANGDIRPVDAEQVRGMIRARRMRAQYFDSGLFADPAWDMLLDLSAAHADGQRVAVSSLCIAAAVPATTALRWIRTLTDTGLFVRHADPHDGRRVFIELGEGAVHGMRAYLDSVARLATAPGMNLAQVAV